MDFFATLTKKQKTTAFDSSSEMHFFLDNSALLADLPQFKGFMRATAPFDVIRANIILRALQNKELIQNALGRINKHGTDEEKAHLKETMEAFLETLPYLKEGKERIFVPIFPRTINRLYAGDFEKFDERPYKSLLRGYSESLAIDPFDAYGYALYDSYFTKLILVDKNDKEAVFLDYDSHSLFAVNVDGRLNSRIALFDKYLGKTYTNHLLERVKPVVAAYLAGDRETMIDALVDNGLISRKLIFKIYYEERKVFSKIYR
ncbi:MAG: hypothetical protein IJU64_06120 [Bacilli bacterium]|nr:hypothetical protein [Bacilli bacterium]